MEKIRLGKFCVDKIDNVSTQGDYDIDYIDISSVDNVIKKITGFNTFNISEAPSRAKQMLEKNDVLVSTVRPNLNAIALCDIDSGNILVGSTGFCVLRGNDKVESRYLFYFCQSKYFINELMNVATGASYPAVSKNDVKNVLISNITLEKQTEIVEILDSIRGILNHRKEQLKLLDDLIKSRFVEMFGTPYGNEKGFQMMTVDDVIEFTGGAQPDKKYFEYESTEENIRLIQIRDYKTDNYITYIPKAMAKRFCDVDDIMIGRYGPPIFQILKGIEGSYNVALMKATPKMGNKEFVRCFLKQEGLFNYLNGLSQRTAGQSGIEMPALKAYPFPYPPIELQEEFEQFVRQVDKLKVEVQKSLDEIQLLFDALMQQYFE